MILQDTYKGVILPMVQDELESVINKVPVFRGSDIRQELASYLPRSKQVLADHVGTVNSMLLNMAVLQIKRNVNLVEELELEDSTASQETLTYIIRRLPSLL